MDRLLNFLFVFVLIALFVLDSTTESRMQILVGIGLALALSFAAFLLNWLTLDGTEASIVTGSIAFGLGGLEAAVLILFFFVTSSLLTPKREKENIHEEASFTEYGQKPRRNGIQVWANGFWFVLCLCLWHMLDIPLFWVGAVGCLATATADTWATELGYHRFKSRAYLIRGFKKVPPGVDGGVSIRGTLAGLAGSLLIAIVAVAMEGVLVWRMLVGISLAGFLGSLADSYMGSIFQYEGRVLTFGLSDYKGINVNNNGVNWAATGIGSLLAIITTNLFKFL